MFTSKFQSKADISISNSALQHLALQSSYDLSYMGEFTVPYQILCNVEDEEIER